MSTTPMYNTLEPVAPWYFFDTITAPEEISLRWGHPLLEWGWGAFTTGRYENGIFEGGASHIDRLIQHAEALLLSPPSHEMLKDQISKWLSYLPQDEPLKIKLSLIAPLGKPIFSAYRLEKKAPRAIPCRLLIDISLPLPRRCPYSRIKSHAHADYVILKHRAKERGYDDMLLTDEHGHIVETSSSAFWIIDNTSLLYPETSLGGLDSITGQLAREHIAPQYGLIATAWRGSVDTISENARCYISNCLNRITPVQLLHDRTCAQDAVEEKELNRLLRKALAATSVGPCT